MSPSGLVIMRLVKDAPGPLVVVATMLPATRSTFGIDTFRAPLLLLVPEPLEAVTACNGLTGSSPLYSSTRRSEEHTSELQSRRDLVCRLLLEKKKKDAPHHRLLDGVP